MIDSAPIRRLVCRYPFEAWNCSACGALIEGQAPVSRIAGLVCTPCLDRGFKGEPFIPLTVRMVKPRERPEERRMLAVSMAERRCLTEEGELFDLEELVERIRERSPGEVGRAGALRPESQRIDPCFVVTDAGPDLIAYLDHSAAGQPAAWQWQVALRAPSAWRPEARSPGHATWLEARAVRFGYASRPGGKRRAGGRARWYEVIDAARFCEAIGDDQLRLTELLRFGIELRAWANDQHLPVLTSASAYGGRLLRDARFGGGWRRKVPAATNAALRRRLPGNHYQLLAGSGRTIPEVHKLDQRSAHHQAALRTTFPHPDLLNAHGWFRRPAPDEGRKALRTESGAIRGGTDQWYELTRQPGVFVISVKVPERVAIDPLQLPALRRPGVRWRTLTSVEIEHVRALQAQGERIGLGDVWCAWTSPESDERLNEYAAWALDQHDRYSHLKRWLKPTLLAAYGMLAARPRRFRNAWRWALNPDGGFGVQTREGVLVGLERSTKTERESLTANVLWRALIEAEVRRESLVHAQRLRADGFNPVAIYADAIFATGDGRPATPPPWRYEGVIHDLTFDSPARYRSREEMRLPGTPRRNGLQRALAKPPTA